MYLLLILLCFILLLLLLLLYKCYTLYYVISYYIIIFSGASVRSEVAPRSFVCDARCDWFGFDGGYTKMCRTINSG